MLGNIFGRSLVLSLSCALTVAGPSWARTETSAKKLQHKLHKLDKTAGGVLQITVGAALIGVAIYAAAVLGSDDSPGASPDQSGDFRTSHSPLSPPPAQTNNRAIPRTGATPPR